MGGWHGYICLRLWHVIGPRGILLLLRKVLLLLRGILRWHPGLRTTQEVLGELLLGHYSRLVIFCILVERF